MTKSKQRPFYQHEYDRVVRAWREKRKLMSRLLDLMDQDESGHEWPGIWWNDTVRDLNALTLQVCVMRQAAKDRDEPLEGVEQDAGSKKVSKKARSKR